MLIEQKVDRFAASREFAMDFLSKEERETYKQYNEALGGLVAQYGELSPTDPMTYWIVDQAKEQTPGAEQVLGKLIRLQIKIFDSGNDQ